MMVKSVRIVLDKRTDEIALRIVRPQGANLRAEKGINLPDSHLAIHHSPKDLHDLPGWLPHRHHRLFVCAQCTPMLKCSMRNLTDSMHIMLELYLKSKPRMPLPHCQNCFLTAMRRPVVGVMVARGDLAVETGFERLAEVQEEILWFCEAAHVSGDLGNTSTRKPC